MSLVTAILQPRRLHDMHQGRLCLEDNIIKKEIQLERSRDQLLIKWQVFFKLIYLQRREILSFNHLVDLIFHFFPKNQGRNQEHPQPQWWLTSQPYKTHRGPPKKNTSLTSWGLAPTSRQAMYSFSALYLRANASVRSADLRKSIHQQL